MTVDAAELERLRRERDLYRSLLELGDLDDLPAFLGRAIALVVETSGAEQGYLELYGAGRGEAGDDGASPLCVAHGFSGEELDGVRRSLSTGILAEALATGKTMATASAVDDPRFAGFASVQAGRIRAVLCAPIALRVDGGLGASLGFAEVGAGLFDSNHHNRAITTNAAINISGQYSDMTVSPGKTLLSDRGWKNTSPAKAAGRALNEAVLRLRPY